MWVVVVMVVVVVVVVVEEIHSFSAHKSKFPKVLHLCWADQAVSDSVAC